MRAPTFLRILLLAIGLTWLWTPAAGQVPASLVQGLEARVATTFQVVDLGDFRLYFSAMDAAYARHVADVVEGSQRRLAEELDLRSFHGSEIVVAWDPPHFYRLAGSGTPHWAGAVANPEQRRIVLKSPRWGDARDDAGATIRHEMTHLAVGRLRRGHWIPVWLEEGLAVHMSGLPLGLNPDGGMTSLSKALSLGELPELDQLEDLHGFGSAGAELAYQQAESAVVYFLERHGRVAMVQLLTLVGRGMGFEEAFDKATGGGYYRFEHDWEDWLDGQRGLYFLVDSASWVWAGIVLLAGIVWWIRRRRAQRILKSWRQEEDEEDDEFLT